MDSPRVIKAITLGSFGVGKTCLLMRASDPSGSISPSYSSTIAIDYRQIEEEFMGRTYKLQIWDTAGQEKYSFLHKAYYRDADAIVLVFDVSNLDSFNRLEELYDEYLRLGGSPTASVLVGNKADREDREVGSGLAQKFANKAGMPYVECSAKSGQGVKSVMKLLLQQVSETERLPIRGSVLSQQAVKDRNGCQC